MHNMNAEFVNGELKLIDLADKWYIQSAGDRFFLYKTGDKKFKEEFFTIQGAITHATTILFPKVPSKLDKYERCQIDIEDGGVKVYSLWLLLDIIQEEHNVDFWETYNKPHGGIEMFIDYLVDNGNMNLRTESDDIFIHDMLDINSLVEDCLQKDIAQFGKKDWRSKMAELLLNELGPEVFISGKEV